MTDRKTHHGLARYYAVHLNGFIYATFESANMAFSWQVGNRRQIALGHDYFHLEDDDGNTVELSMNQYGHASAVLDKLDDH